MTTQDALNWINGGWRSSRFARTIPVVGTGIDVDRLYGMQCKDFANGYADYMGAPFTSGNAIALWRVNQPGWHKVSTPQIGDVFVRDYISGGVNYGDTGVVKSVGNGTVRVVQQNLAGNLQVGSPPAEATYNQSIMLGYLRNNKIGEPVATDKLTKEDIIVIYDLAFEVDDWQVPQDIINAYVGKPLSGLLTQLHQDPSWLAHKESQGHTPGFKKVTKQLYEEDV